MGAGTTIGAFRVERLITAGSTGAVYEATQLSLRRVVALRVIPRAHFTTPDQLARFDQRQRLAASLHHPNLVPCYEFGEWEGGRFVATRLIRGRTLAQLRAQGSPPAAESLEPLAGALEAAHAAGLVHGRISDANVLVEADGTPYLADLGLGEGASTEADAEALAAVVSRLPARTSHARARRRRRTLGVALVAVALLVAAVLAVAMSGGEDSRAVAGPLGCRANHSANTPACTLAQVRLHGRAVTVPRTGVIRAWSVRGASGELALQVIRERDGKWFVAGFSQPERLTSPALRRFPANIAVAPGERIGVRLGPGAVVGRSPSPRSALARWDGGLTAGPQPVDATLGGEVMLRADIEFGRRPGSPRQLRGRQAEAAPPGRRLEEAPVALSGGRPAQVVVVELPGRIAIDLIGDRRLTRLEVPDADPAGELLEVEQSCGPAGAGGFCLRWRNPGEDLALKHEYDIREDGSIKVIG